jgi:hypothetical protein
MALALTYWERRDGIDRDAFARAALDLCRAARTRPGFRGSRFYWAGIDTIAVVADVESMEAVDTLPTPESSRAAFALSDLARQVRTERLMDAARGEQAYRAGQR